jgi:two-component system KDP operon response regulator KdpE
VLALFDAMRTIKSFLKRRHAAALRALDSLRVLVVEDQRDLRELFAALLAGEGAAVTQVGTGREAIALSSTHKFDIVFTDLGLPDISGDLLVRQLLATAKPLVVVITGQGEPHLGRAKAAGAHAVFQKPIEWHRIVTCLRHSSAAKSA